MPQTKEEKAETQRLYYIANKEELVEKHRLYKKANKEKIKEQKRLWHEKNKEKNNEIHRLYRQTPSGIRSNHYSDWRKVGVIFESDEDRDVIWERYLQSTHCEVCNKEYKNRLDRCLDHDHDITDAPNFRQILCRNCNNQDNWKNHTK